MEKDSLNDDLASTFLNKQYHTCKTLDELILYRVFGLYEQASGEVKGARSSGGFASTEFAESLIDAKERLALDPKWFSTKAYEEKILLPKGCIINVGIVSPVTLKTGAVFRRGGSDFAAEKLVGRGLDNRLSQSDRKTADKPSRV